MKAVLEKMDDADELDPQAKNWRKDIIDMSYDIEDYIDDFMGSVGEADDNVGALQKFSHYLRTFKEWRRLADQFQEIKTLVIEAGERRKRYMLDQCIPSTSTNHVIVDPRLSALYQKSASLVGIDSQRKDIVGWVMDDEGQQLKVMSIVGFGGLGKTTLANEVYREVGGKFNCKAFVSISQKPNPIKLLNSLMLQLELQPYSHACEPQDLINNIIKHLQDMRYFIIVDDLWDIQAWNTISCAFPQNNHHSRVIVTTRNENVARACCGNHGFIHNMKPLSEQDSRKLFLDRICESEDAYPLDFIQDSCKILKKCGGLPLAIITMASMIACQPTTRSKWQWAEYIQNSLGAKLLATNPSYEDMMHILDFSYKNLPCYVKACFLYLGTYPEDHKISRANLVRRWVAEGFVNCSHGQDVWDAAESYFSELVNRSMIQQAYDDFDDICIEVTHCRVHDMMLELILMKCREDNFISLIDGPAMIPKGKDKVIRRLTIDLRGVEDGITVMTNNTMHLSKVRSLNIFRGDCRIPNLRELKFMRLLFLDFNYLESSIDLSGMNHLSQLRYLMVKGYNAKVLLPAQIQSLRVLETFDLSMLSPYVSGLAEIVDVPRLSHISVPLVKKVRLPDGIDKAKSLLTLSGFHLDMSSLQSITGLGELTAVSELILFDMGTREKNVPVPIIIAALITCLENLGNLRNLSLLWEDTAYCSDAMLGSSFSPPFHKIERLNLGLLIFSRIPRWIGHLSCLHELLIQAKQIHQEDLERHWDKANLPHQARHVDSTCPSREDRDRRLHGILNVLKKFEFNCDEVSCLTFEIGAMPDLQELRLGMDLHGWDKATPVGLQHLPSLKKINLDPVTTLDWVVFRGSKDAEWRVAREQMLGVFQEAADTLPTQPTLYAIIVMRRPQVIG